MDCQIPHQNSNEKKTKQRIIADSRPTKQVSGFGGQETLSLLALGHLAHSSLAAVIPSSFAPICLDERAGNNVLPHSRCDISIHRRWGGSVVSRSWCLDITGKLNGAAV